MKFVVSDLSQLKDIAKEIIKNSPYRLFLVYGEMGTGKTTLIKAIGKQLNTIDEIISPTFAIANVYETQTKEQWYHLDLYRIKDKQELIEIGIEEYLYTSNYCFIEWPELVEPFIDIPATKIVITLSDDNKRIITVNTKPPTR